MLRSFLLALQELGRHFEWMEGDSTFVLAMRTRLLAAAMPVSEEVEIHGHVDVQKPQTLCHVVLLPHVIGVELRPAPPAALEKRLHRGAGKDLDGTVHEARVLLVLAIGEEGRVVGARSTTPEAGTEPLREEHGVRVDLDDPVGVPNVAELLDLIPRAEELLGVLALCVAAVAGPGQIRADRRRRRARRRTVGETNLGVTKDQPTVA
mmetsp:Transcript_29549/g.89431  ORF Transcript_29549/g.89431 Transcript_29549/m.89431 type:complete len:207 (-) Transcript_29549:132-752(-)